MDDAHWSRLCMLRNRPFAEYSERKDFNIVKLYFDKIWFVKFSFRLFHLCCVPSLLLLVKR